MFSQASGITTDSNGNVYVGDLTGVERARYKNSLATAHSLLLGGI